MLARDVLYAFIVISRSGRTAALLGEQNMESEVAEMIGLDRIISQMAARAHSPTGDPERHLALSNGLAEAFTAVERVPGTVVRYSWPLADGRSAGVIRHIAGDMALQNIRT